MNYNEVPVYHTVHLLWTYWSFQTISLLDVDRILFHIKCNFYNNNNNYHSIWVQNTQYEIMRIIVKTFAKNYVFWRDVPDVRYYPVSSQESGIRYPVSGRISYPVFLVHYKLLPNTVFIDFSYI